MSALLQVCGLLLAGVWLQAGESVHEAKLLPPGVSPRDSFGSAVAVHGDVGLIGAKFSDGPEPNTGLTYAFLRRDEWTLQQAFSPGGLTRNAFFGHCIVASADRALIGAPGQELEQEKTGAVYVFALLNGQWKEEACLFDPSGAEGDHFGGSAALFGTTALIGARHDDKAGTNSGSAHVFMRDGPDWGFEQTLIPDACNEGDNFGSCVALLDDTAFVGADHRDEGAGAVYVFTRDEKGWREAAKLVAGDRSPRDFFGRSIAVSMETLLVGAPQDDDAGQDSGSVYVFERSGADWVEVKTLRGTGCGAKDNFGLSLSIEGHTAVIGARGNVDRGTGSVHVFGRRDGLWVELQRLRPTSEAGQDRFGIVASYSRGTVLAGADRDAQNGPFAGAAYAFTLVE